MTVSKLDAYLDPVQLNIFQLCSTICIVLARLSLRFMLPILLHSFTLRSLFPLLLKCFILHSWFCCFSLSFGCEDHRDKASTHSMLPAALHLPSKPAKRIGHRQVENFRRSMYTFAAPLPPCLLGAAAPRGTSRRVPKGWARAAAGVDGAHPPPHSPPLRTLAGCDWPGPQADRKGARGPRA